jgi:hypothetical protein
MDKPKDLGSWCARKVKQGGHALSRLVGKEEPLKPNPYVKLFIYKLFGEGFFI